MTALLQALCCVCGQIRTCKRPRNYRRENYWLSGTIDRDWHRETGDLKCDTCGQVTTHAIVGADIGSFRDHAERITNIALGMKDPTTDESPKLRAKIVDAYRNNNFPANPYVNHRWWKNDEHNARAAGKKWFRGMCGEPVEVPEVERADGRDITEMEPPTQATDPIEDERQNDVDDTGLWWHSSAGECVNCLRVRNEWLLRKRRKDLSLLLLKMAANIDDVDAQTVNQLADVVDRANPGCAE